MAEKPVILLAFAQDQDGHCYLRDLPAEQRRLREILRGAKEQGLCELEILPNATLGEIADVFGHYEHRVAVFHYGGHAGQAGLLLESSGREARTAHPEGLAGLLREHGAPYLVFLNACATWVQVRGLHNSGVRAVIATARAIRDEQARKLAETFYGRLAKGESLDTAFRQALSVVCLPSGNDPQAYINREVITRVNANRDLISIGATSEIDDQGLPWKLSPAPEAPLAGEWSLRTVDPLWGLGNPELPQPETPYIGLRAFTRHDAGVFFGRRAEIRELYDAAITPGVSPLIFFYGQSGVGKSSVLDAGLVPWLSQCCTVRYVRRDPRLGLLGTLRYELAQAAGRDATDNKADVSKLWEEVADRSPDRHLVVILDQTEDVFLRPYCKETTTPPTSSDTDAQAELASFFDELKRLPIGPDLASRRHVLILSFRKEWQPEFRRAAGVNGLIPGEVFLRPLGRAGIIEAIEGPSRVTTRPRSERPEIAWPGLADEIATDILRFVADPEKNRLYPLTPTLQSLLERMWIDAKKLNNVEPVFDRELFIAAQKDGYGLDRYLGRGLSALEKWRAEVVESGLALDLLDYHTKPLGTADQHTPAELHERYKDCRNLLDNLVQECKNNYLLIDVPPPAPPGTTRLPHDTLAPVVKDEFGRSLKPGQRARRLLENRAEWRDGNEGPVLAAVDLAAVESGRKGMRSLTTDEQRLVDATRLAVQQQKAKERRNRQILRGLAISLAVAFVASLITAVVAWIQWGAAQRETKFAQCGRLAALSDAVRPERLDLAMLLALEAAKEGGTLEARGSLQRSLDARPEVVRFLHVPEGDVTSVAFGPEGRIAAGYGVYDGSGGVVVLFDAGGKRLRPPLEVKEGSVESVAFGPEGQIAAGYAGGGGGVMLFDARGERLRPPLEVKEGGVRSVAFGPEGRIAAGYGFGDRGGVVLFDARGKRLRTAPLEVKEGGVRSVAFGPEGQIAAGYAVGRGPGGGVVLFDARGERLRTAPLEVKEGGVTSVAFGPEGQIAAGYSILGVGLGVGRGGGGVVLFDARGERLRPAPLKVKEGDVTSVAFGPEGQIAAGHGRGFGDRGGVVLFDARGERLRTAPLEVKEGQVSSVAFGPEGQIAAGYSVLGVGRGGGGGVVLFDARGERLRTAPLEVKEGQVSSVAFGPEGQIAAGYGIFGDRGGGRSGVGGVVLFDARGERLRLAPLEVKEGIVTSVAFGPEGQIAAGYGIFGDRGGVVLFDARGERLRPAPLGVDEGKVSVAFGPEGRIAAGFRVPFVCNRGGVVLFDARGERLRTAPLEVEGQVSSVAFGPEGRIAAGHGRGRGGGGVMLFDDLDKRLRTAPLEVKEGDVSSVAFGPEGRIAAGYGVRFGDVGVGGVVLFDARGERLPPAPLKVKEGDVTSVAFGPEGKIAAGYGVYGGSGGVVLFDADPASWLRKAGQTANRNFTRLEWTRYFPETLYRRTIRSLPWPHDLPEAERKQAEAFEKEHPEGSDAS